MDVTVIDQPDDERYEALVGGDHAGYLVYKRRKRLIAFLHTEVDEAFEGKGVGGELARRALDDARRDGLMVLPFCPFVRGWIERHPDYVDLVPEAQRANFELVAG